MPFTQRLRQAGAATLGAIDWTTDQATTAWQHRDQWGRHLSDVYTDLAERGQTRLSGAEKATRRQARAAGLTAWRLPGVAPLEGEARGLTADPEQLPIGEYDTRNVEQITRQLPNLSQRELHQIEGYESTHQARVTVLRRIDELRGQEPWPAYDELTVEEILDRLHGLPADQQHAVGQYEQRHQQRRTILQATGQH